VRGVFLNRRTGRYYGQVKVGDKTYHVGTFGSVADADEAVRAKRMELFTHNRLDRVKG